MTGREPIARRLIEVDLPIRRISTNARPEKTTVHGNISTLHIWWARRPHAACRAIACAALWFDPVDSQCPAAFRASARKAMESWASDRLKLCSPESLPHFVLIQKDPARLDDHYVLRHALLDFIADFSRWESQSSPEFMAVARALTTAATGDGQSRPLVFDPFAGGGTIPVECMRVGADVFASDLNPIAVLLNRVILEFIPRWGDALKERISVWGARVQSDANRLLSPLYPMDEDGARPLVYLWSRTILCEGPNCGYKVPLIRSMDLGGRQYLTLTPDKKDRSFSVSISPKPADSATVKGGSATCPAPGCGYTTPAKAVRAQLSSKGGGSKDAQLLGVLIDRDGRRVFRSPSPSDIAAASQARVADPAGLPDATINPIRPHKNTRGLSAVTRIGATRFQDLYTNRQLRAIEVFTDVLTAMIGEGGEGTIDQAAFTVLGLCLGRLLQQNSTCARWRKKAYAVAGSFGKQALQVVWDFAEIAPMAEAAGSWMSAIEWATKVVDLNKCLRGDATTARAAAQECPLPNDSAAMLFTDPPYFAAIPYADLAGFFYVWERKVFRKLYPTLFDLPTIDQEREIIVTDANLGPSGIKKDDRFFRDEMAQALTRARQIVVPNGLGVVVFADTRTESWETLLKAVIDSGWMITASWPIDTEHQNRTQAQGSASLQSSIHLVCRPRADSQGVMREDVGDWRDVLTELPKRMHEWMPRLAEEGVVGADAIFACLGPALEVFSRYSHVEKTSGERVDLKEYLVHVWAAVAKEALAQIFEGADATGFEEDARLSAMWLWTLSSNASEHPASSSEDDEDGETDGGASSEKKLPGFALEYDAARKIAQGLGVHLEELHTVVEVRGDTARLLSVAERTRALFGKDQSEPGRRRSKKKDAQLKLDLVEELEEVVEEGKWSIDGDRPLGATVLDRVHQAMILFGAGRGEAVRRFVTELGVGNDVRFWRLADNLSKLYPSGTDEKRWVDGILARKKGFGF